MGSEKMIDACYCFVPENGEDELDKKMKTQMDKSKGACFNIDFLFNDIESQKKRLAVFSQFCGFNPVYFVDDKDVFRTALQRLVKEIEGGKVRTVVVTCPNYIPRDLIRRVMYNTDFKWLDFVGFESETKASNVGFDMDEYFEKAKRIVLTTRIATVSHLQRSLGLGYARATFLLNQLENAGIVGPYNPDESWKPRDILLPNPEENRGGLT